MYYYVLSMFNEKIYQFLNKMKRGSPRGIVAKVLDCDVIVSEFEFKFRY